MNTVDTHVPRLAPTDGQLALAEALARGETRPAEGIRKVPASVYTDPAHWQREKAALFDRLRAGTARRVKKPGQVFNRIHEDDAARGFLASMARPRPGGVYTLCDDEPSPADEVIDWAAAQQLGVSIHVEKANPARTLYHALGFAVRSDAGAYDLMERPLA